jgi:hypothetical protein
MLVGGRIQSRISTHNYRSRRPKTSGTSDSGPVGIHLIRIRIQHFRLTTNPDSDPIRVQEFEDQKFKKLTTEKKFWDQKLQFGYPLAYIKNVQVTEEPSALKKNIQHFKTFFLRLWVILPSWIRIWIPNRDLDTDPLT